MENLGLLQTAGCGYVIKTFELSQEQHEMVVNMVRRDKFVDGNYTLERADADTIDIWIDDANQEGRTEYAEFLAEAQLNDLDVLTLTDHLGEFPQPIGEVSVQRVPMQNGELSENAKSYLETAYNNLQLAYNYAEGNEPAMEEISTAMDIIQNLI